MSAPASTKAFGMKLGGEPRKLVVLVGLILVAAAVYFFNSGGETNPVQAPTARTPSGVGASGNGVSPTRLHTRRKTQRTNERNVLRMEEVTVEASRGDIDPTLRLDLLQRLKNVKFAGLERNLFEAGAANTPQMALVKPVKIMPGPLHETAPLSPAGQAMTPAGLPPIPLKFYGFAAPSVAGGVRRGFFLNQDNVIIADQGETVMGRYRIVDLQTKSAEVEDVMTKSLQSLPIIPESTAGAM